MPDAARRRALTSLGALLLPTAATAESPPAPLRLTVVSLLPWAGYTPQGEPTGALIMLVRQLGKLSSVPIAPLVVPYSRAPHMLAAGAADLMLLIDISTIGTPLEWLGAVEIMMFGRSGFRFQRLDQLSGKTVGHLRGARYSPDIDAAPGIVKHPVDSYEQGVRMLLAGRLDAMFGVGDSIEYALRTLQVQPQQVSPRYLLARGKVALYGDSALPPPYVTALQGACRLLRQEHVLDRLLKRPRPL
ncbi:substrate-binding periplasmic protein [Duganella callida]|uniref:Transporter substrate-binding domain-containing protein n=1 Tax=Duganella callida TaxID=2561932 RepID=A0A4Y9S2B4_9BURK|nr:hypothetical protein [Duganella callida]TFW15442.1 hypothetical protein E4L98_26655 [Duganella callida]